MPRPASSTPASTGRPAASNANQGTNSGYSGNSGGAGGTGKKAYWDPWTCSFTGRLVAAPEVKTTAQGAQFCVLTIARQKGDNAYFHKCVAWQQVAEHILSTNPQKGDPVRVFVDVSEREYPDKDNPETKKYMTQWEIKEYHKRAASKPRAAVNQMPGDDDEPNID